MKQSRSLQAEDASSSFSSSSSVSSLKTNTTNTSNFSENPLISDNHIDRVKNGLEYACNRGWSCHKAAAKAGVAYNTLRKAIESGGVIAVRGRRPLLTNDDLVKVKERMQHNSSVKTSRTFEESVVEVLREKQSDLVQSQATTPTNISRRSMTRYKHNIVQTKKQPNDVEDAQKRQRDEIIVSKVINTTMLDAPTQQPQTHHTKKKARVLTRRCWCCDEIGNIHAVGGLIPCPYKTCRHCYCSQQDACKKSLELHQLVCKKQ